MTPGRHSLKVICQTQQDCNQIHKAAWKSNTLVVVANVLIYDFNEEDKDTFVTWLNLVGVIILKIESRYFSGDRYSLTIHYGSDMSKWESLLRSNEEQKPQNPYGGIEMGHVALAVITGTEILVPYFQFKSLQLISWSDTDR